MNIFSNFFESYGLWLMLYMIISFLLGLILGWLIFRFKNDIKIVEGIKEEEQIIIKKGPRISKTVTYKKEDIKPIISKKDAITAITTSLGSKIPIAIASDKDDLRKIIGINPFIEEKLNNLGIFSFEQISLFDQNYIDNVTTAIDFIPGRIERDNWVNQAKELLN